MSVMHKHRRNPILLGEDNNALTWMLIINAVVFVGISFIRVVYFFSYETPMEATQNFNLQILNWFTLPPDVHTLVSRPWTILTYMVTHSNVWQLIGTLLWLWAFGYILQDLTGNTKLIPLYIYSGLAAALVFILMWNIIPDYKTNIGDAQPFTGGEAAITGIAMAVTTIAPRYKLFPMIGKGIPLWVLTLLFITIDYASIASGDITISIAHLASAVTGFIFAYQLQKGNDWSAWMVNFANWVNDLFNPEKKYAKKPVTQQRHYKAVRKPFEKTPRVTQQTLDEILDKINLNGYNSLSDEEKDFLKKASQEDI